MIAFLSVILFLLSSVSAFGFEPIPADSANFRGRIPAGQRLTFVFGEDRRLETIAPDDGLTELANSAVAKAPEWLREDLEDMFSRLDVAYQEIYGGLILEAEDPIVDEVAFQVAHLAPEDLVRLADENFEQLLVENAESVYHNDFSLDYVQVVDHGSSLDYDYYSTTSYRLSTAAGDTVDFEIPSEYYYWYIVHPVALRYINTTKTIGYIDPNTDANASPPQGVFWREYLFEHADEGYPMLKQVLSGCGTVWNSLANVADSTNGAVGIVTRWVQDVLDFDSGRWRPVQPVSIYHLHLGRCSEHAALTTAAARATLIPTTSAQAMANDHHWNEFWLDRWVQWEPVNAFIDNPQAYEGWGWSFSGIVDHRGDGYVWSVTERYTPYGRLTVEVLDSEGTPVDGAKVYLQAPHRYETWGISTCAWQYTDSAGRCEFTVGDSLDYYVAVESRIGSLARTNVISEAQAGRDYSCSVKLSRTVPVLQLEPQERIAEGSRTAQIQFQVPTCKLYGKHHLTGETFSQRLSPGKIDFFVCDSANYSKYIAGEPFETYEVMSDVPSGFISFAIPEGNWYAVFSNERSLTVAQEVETKVLLYEDWASVAEEESEHREDSLLLGNFPNPFNHSTTFRFSLPESVPVDISIYDSTGRTVRRLRLERGSGPNSVAWNGTDDEGLEVASGVYIYKITTDTGAMARKMLLLR